MDLNYILHRHQLALMQADVAVSTEARKAHRAFAREYASHIRTAQSLSGATARLACAL